MTLAILMLSSCGDSSQSIESPDTTSETNSTKLSEALEVKKDINLKVQGYLDYNCAPKYVTRINDLGDGITSKAKVMKVYSEELIGELAAYGPAQEDKYFLIRDQNDSTYGNFATRTIYLASLYHANLAWLYQYVYDLHSSELKSLRKDFTRFRKIADTAASKICKITKENLKNEILNASDVVAVQQVYDELVANWDGFKSWNDAAKRLEEQVSIGISESNLDFMTPKCAEYPTADGKYVVVKCTLPPG